MRSHSVPGRQARPHLEVRVLHRLRHGCVNVRVWVPQREWVNGRVDRYCMRTCRVSV